MKKNILILGGAGFIGKNLVEELKNDYDLIVFGRKENCFAGNNPLFYKGDFSESRDLEIIFGENKIDLVIHLISTTIPSISNENMSFDVDSNLTGTINLLNLMKKYSVPKIIFVSSGGTIYGKINPSIDSVSENHPTNPICSHGIIKLAIEKYILLYHHLYGIDYLILRVSNAYGENHASDRLGLINVALKKIINKQSVQIWGDGMVIRDYIYAKDCVSIIRKLIEKGISNEIINVGSGIGHSINDILSIIQKIAGDFNIEKSEMRNFDVPKIILNTNKLKSFIDFELTDIEVGIRNTYNWLKNKYGK